MEGDDDDESRIAILLCTANLGNAPPDQESWDHLVPNDGRCDHMVSQYPLRRTMNAVCHNENGFLEERKQFDLIVFGFQEATFEETSMEESQHRPDLSSQSIPEESCLAPESRRASTERSSMDSESAFKAKLRESKLMGKKVVKHTQSAIESLTASRDNMSTRNIKESYSCKRLRFLMLNRLPSYERIVSYQRGEMRLEILVHRRQIEATVIHVSAQNTGRAGLANKGGIVAELLINRTTRISFLTAHLEAHEGRYKPRTKTRVTTLGDIFSGTKEKDYDCSLTAHYSFVMGDLNFRSEHPDHETMGEEKHKEMIMDMVERKDWEALNKIDELHRALKNGDCCVGYETPRCQFPPTFKVERQLGYQYIEKRRPSYTDRVLWKANHSLHTGIEPLLYEPIDTFTSSDHKPVRAAVAVNLNPSFRMRPRMIKTTSSRRLKRKGKNKTLEMGAKERCHIFVSNMSCSVKTARGGNAGFDMAPNPYITLVTNPPEILLKHPEKRKFGKVRRKLVNSVASLSFVRATKRTKQGFPRSSIHHHKNNAEFLNEEITAEIFTHAPSGEPHDLSGLQLFLTVMDRRRNVPDDNVLGTVVVNLIQMIQKCRSSRDQSLRDDDPNSLSKSFTMATRPRKSVMNLFRTSSMDVVEASNNGLADDRIPIEVLEVDEPILKNGVITGRLCCRLEVWWINSYLGGSAAFEPRQSLTAARLSHKAQ